MIRPEFTLPDWSVLFEAGPSCVWLKVLNRSTRNNTAEASVGKVSLVFFWIDMFTLLRPGSSYTPIGELPNVPNAG